MCLVSFVPTGKKEFILSSNRDESPKRPVSEITTEYVHGEELIYPKELKGGSWIFASSRDQLICVLNGGHVKHKHDPPYRRSRGLILRDFFDYLTAVDFFEKIDLWEIEPFTSVIYDRGRLFDLVWDGQVKHIRNLNPQQIHVWSSSTLYTPDIQMERETEFRKWFGSHPDLELTNIKKLHRSGMKGDAMNGFIMNRENRVMTVSITHVVKGGQRMTMYYEDLLDGRQLEASVKTDQLLV